MKIININNMFRMLETKDFNNREFNKFKNNNLGIAGTFTKHGNKLMSNFNGSKENKSIWYVDKRHKHHKKR